MVNVEAESVRGEIIEAALDAALDQKKWDRSIFRLAQVLRAVSGWEQQELREAVQRLRERTNHPISQADAMEDFNESWEVVECPDWWLVLVAMARAKDTPVPEELRTDGDRLQALGVACSLLQQLHVDGTFFLSVSGACEVMGLDPKEQREQAYRKLAVLKKRGLLVEVERGSRRWVRKGVATATEWLWSPAFPSPTGQMSEEGGTR